MVDEKLRDPQSRAVSMGKKAALERSCCRTSCSHSAAFCSLYLICCYFVLRLDCTCRLGTPYQRLWPPCEHKVSAVKLKSVFGFSDCLIWEIFRGLKKRKYLIFLLKKNLKSKNTRYLCNRFLPLLISLWPYRFILGPIRGSQPPGLNMV